MSFFQNLPKPVLVLGILILGTIFFIVMSPPHSVCDSQSTLFKDLQKGFLFPNQVKKPKSKGKAQTLQPKYPLLLENCRIGNNAGACYELFSSMRKVLKDVDNAPSECAGAIGDIKEVKSAVNQVGELMVRIAWGASPPALGLDRFGWLDTLELSFFCQLKSTYVKSYGEEAWEQFRKKVAMKLPGAYEDKKALLSEEEIWGKSIFSIRCDQY